MATPAVTLPLPRLSVPTVKRTLPPSTIVPADVCRRLFKSTLRSVEFRLDNEQQTKTVADELTRRFALAQFAGFDDGVRMISASNLASVSGAGQVAVPLLLAGLIIFNTMMGSIAERRREIHVYTSLGLAPLHVGALFVAEALTYGLIGTVFGGNAGNTRPAANNSTTTPSPSSWPSASSRSSKPRTRHSG